MFGVKTLFYTTTDEAHACQAAETWGGVGGVAHSGCHLWLGKRTSPHSDWSAARRFEEAQSIWVTRRRGGGRGEKVLLVSEMSANVTESKHCERKRESIELLLVLQRVFSYI